MKIKQKKIAKTTLSDKIADALTVKPRPDIEDDHIFNTKPNTVTRADFNASSSEDEAFISNFRKRNVKLLSDINKKYEGKVVTRKELEQNSEDSSSEESLSLENDIERETRGSSDGNEADNNINETNFLKSIQESDDSDEESVDYSITQTSKKDSHDSDDTEEDDDADGSAEEDDENDETGYDISQMEEPVQEEFEHVKKQNISEEAKKGACVRNQLLLWEGLLEMRIHMQRCVNTANRMPMPESYNDLKSSKDFAVGTSMAINNVATALDKLLTLQSLLFKNFPETKTLTNNKNMEDTSKKNNESDEEIPSDTDNEEIPSDTDPEDESTPDKPLAVKQKVKTKKRNLNDYESDIADIHKRFKAFRDTTIQKWNEKTRIATAANIKSTPTNTILQQISYLLSDRNKLLRRTQLKRSEYDIIGYKKEETIDNQNAEQSELNPVTKDRKDDDEYIPEIFDDSDFYHQLLRELIECKSADISDPVQLSRQWIALQQMRSKMKRKVDTKATKGRKIKYVVHNKLVNYMAPEKSFKWNEESTTELYNSLFGKMFEQNNVGLNINL